MYKFTITDPEIISFNRFKKMDKNVQRVKIHKLKQRLVHEIISQVGKCKPLKRPAHISFNLYGSYAQDLDNIFSGHFGKAVIDSCVNANMIYDDNLKHVHRITYDFRGNSDGNYIEVVVREAERP